jgi:hypothetical protein
MKTKIKLNDTETALVFNLDGQVKEMYLPSFIAQTPENIANLVEIFNSSLKRFYKGELKLKLNKDGADLTIFDGHRKKY